MSVLDAQRRLQLALAVGYWTKVDVSPAQGGNPIICSNIAT